MNEQQQTSYQVWKFEVGMPNENGEVWMNLPDGARILSVGFQEFQMVVWALVDRPMPTSHIHKLLVVNTGMTVPTIPESARFIGTVTAINGMVWHVWDAA